MALTDEQYAAIKKKYEGGSEESGILLDHVTKPATRLEKAEMSAVKKAILSRFKEGERVVDKTTGAIGVVDKSSPTGVRPLYKATNTAAGHALGSVTLGKEAVQVSKSRRDSVTESARIMAYGTREEREAHLEKVRKSRPAERL